MIQEHYKILYIINICEYKIVTNKLHCTHARI